MSNIQILIYKLYLQSMKMKNILAPYHIHILDVSCSFTLFFGRENASSFVEMKVLTKKFAKSSFIDEYDIVRCLAPRGPVVKSPFLCSE